MGSRKNRNKRSNPACTELTRLWSASCYVPAPQRDLPDSFFEPFQCLRRNSTLRPLLAHIETESQKLPLLRFRHRALRLIHLEFQLVRDESLHALHHPLPRPLATYVDITIIRVPNKTMAARL